jgi:hypothetical protein
MKIPQTEITNGLIKAEPYIKIKAEPGQEISWTI